MEKRVETAVARGYLLTFRRLLRGHGSRNPPIRICNPRVAAIRTRPRWSASGADTRDACTISVAGSGVGSRRPGRQRRR